MCSRQTSVTAADVPTSILTGVEPVLKPRPRQLQIAMHRGLGDSDGFGHLRIGEATEKLQLEQLGPTGIETGEGL